MYHINDNYDVRLCRAKTPERCKFYNGENDSRHYEATEEATIVAENLAQQQTGNDLFHSAKKVKYNYAGMEQKERTEKLAEDLEKAIDEIVASGNLSGYFDAIAQNGVNRWSFNNILIAGFQLHDWKKANNVPMEKDIFREISNMDVCGAKQWASRGRKITSGKGSALYILAPVIKKDKVLDLDTGKPKLDENGKPKTKDRLVGYRSVAVFDKSQTDGEPIPENPIKIKAIEKEVDQKYVHDMKNMIKDLGYTYSEKEIATDPDNLVGTLGYTRPSDMSVVVDSRISNAQKASIIAHELSHIQMGHVSKEKMAEYSTHRGQMETEAEGLAYMLMRRMGLDAEESKAFSPGYIAGWSKGNKETIKTALNKITNRFGKITTDLGW